MRFRSDRSIDPNRYRNLTEYQGKSLSLICGSLRWLKDNQESENMSNKDQDKQESDSSEPAWLRAYVPINRKEQFEKERRRLRRQQLRERIERIRRGQILEYGSKEPRPRKKAKLVRIVKYLDYQNFIACNSRKDSCLLDGCEV